MWYLVCILIGIIAGIILWENIGVDDVYKGKFKFKQRGRHNRQDNQVNAKFEPKKGVRDRKQRRIDKRSGK
jgi:hypothetical protein